MRQNIRSFALAAGCCGCLMALPGAGYSQWYLNAEAGVSLAQKVDVHKFFDVGNVPPGAKAKFDPGASFGVAGGFNINPWIGVELQTGFIYNSIKNVDASLSHVPLMGNVVLRYDQPNCNWVPYIGGGGGGDVSIIDLNNVSTTIGGLPAIANGAETTVRFAWQVFGGLRYKFNPTMSIGAGYKYYSVDGATWDFAGITDAIRFGHARSHNILVEFNMKF